MFRIRIHQSAMKNPRSTIYLRIYYSVPLLINMPLKKPNHRPPTANDQLTPNDRPPAADHFCRFRKMVYNT